ncbi:MAG: CRISPR-associated endonuclease Cas6 [Calditrichaceae bacterium]
MNLVENQQKAEQLQLVRTIRLTFPVDSFTPADIPRLRAFLARQFPDYHEFHNHTGNGGFRWVYPEIQFKFIKGVPCIVGYGPAIDILAGAFMKIQRIEINHKIIEVPERSIEFNQYELGMSPKFIRYRFSSPWMALNEENYRKYNRLDPIEQESMLNRILWGNIRTLAHAFDYWIEDQDALRVSGHFKMKTQKFKGTVMSTFMGEFIANFFLPDDLGLGKQVARGYGAIRKAD